MNYLLKYPIFGNFLGHCSVNIDHTFLLKLFMKSWMFVKVNNLSKNLIFFKRPSLRDWLRVNNQEGKKITIYHF